MNDSVPAYESIMGDDITYYFAFEPDPDYNNGPGSFSVDVVTRSDSSSGTLFFSSLEDMEECAKIMLDYVYTHKK